MSSTTMSLLDQILALPREEREDLVHHILVSLEPETEEEAAAEAEWQKELQLRLDSIADGTAPLLEFDQSMAEIREALKQNRKL